MLTETIFTKLTEHNFIQYCDYHYDNPTRLEENEFDQDLKIVNDIYRLFKRIEDEKTCNTKLIVNQMIILSNVFGILPTVRILFFKIDRKYHKYLIQYLNEIEYLSDFNIQFLKKHDGIDIYGNEYLNS